MKYVIGLDGGTQSTKVAIYDLQGRVICEEKASLSPLYSPDADTAEHPGDDLWDSLKATGKGLMAKFQGDPNDIIAIGAGQHPLLPHLSEEGRYPGLSGHQLDG